MANLSPFLKDIENFSKNRLRKVQTKVITADGQRLVETKDAQGNIIVKTEDGKIVPSQESPPDKVSAPKKQPTTNGAQPVNTNETVGEDSEESNTIKSGLARSRLDRQASIDAIKSSTSIKNKLGAFAGGGTPTPEKSASATFRKSPGNLPKPDQSSGSQNFDRASPPPPIKAPIKSNTQTTIASSSKPTQESDQSSTDIITQRLQSGKQTVEILPGIVMGFKDLKERLPDLSGIGVTHVLNFLPRLTLDNSSQKSFFYKKVDIADTPLTDIRQYFQECFDFIDEAKKYKGADGTNGKVLLFCNENESISSCILLGYLIKVLGKSYSDAYNLLHEKRPGAKPSENFLRRLKHFEKDLEEDELFTNLGDDDLEALAKELDSDLDTSEKSSKSPSPSTTKFKPSPNTTNTKTAFVPKSTAGTVQSSPIPAPPPPPPLPKSRTPSPTFKKGPTTEKSNTITPVAQSKPNTPASNVTANTTSSVSKPQENLIKKSEEDSKKKRLSQLTPSNIKPTNTSASYAATNKFNQNKNLINNNHNNNNPSTARGLQTSLGLNKAGQKDNTKSIKRSNSSSSSSSSSDTSSTTTSNSSSSSSTSTSSNNSK